MRCAVLLTPLMLAGMLACHRATPPPSSGTPPDAVVTPEIERLVLFFPGNDALLHRESREIAGMPTSAVSRVRVVVQEVLAGPRTELAPAVSWTATVGTVLIDPESNAFVDLDAPPPDAVQGSAGEIALVYAVVNSVVANCKGVARVQLLFDGQEVETLGHLDIGRPLAPRTDLVAP